MQDALFEKRTTLPAGRSVAPLPACGGLRFGLAHPIRLQQALPQLGGTRELGAMLVTHGLGIVTPDTTLAEGRRRAGGGAFQRVVHGRGTPRQREGTPKTRLD